MTLGMRLSPGDKLGAYDILGPLGRGGMGEVYRARDDKLNREVAIKVLPSALADNADYRDQFKREAQSLAALNHPNIAMIYGLEGNAIVMELVEGESPRALCQSLKPSLSRGKLPRHWKLRTTKASCIGI